MGRKVKPVYFNEEKDKELLKYVDNLKNFSVWVKEQIKKNIHIQKNVGADPDLEELIEKLIDKKLAALQANNIKQQDFAKHKQKQRNDKSQILKDIEEFF